MNSSTRMHEQRIGNDVEREIEFRYSNFEPRIQFAYINFSCGELLYSLDSLIFSFTTHCCSTWEVDAAIWSERKRTSVATFQRNNKLVKAQTGNGTKSRNAKIKSTPSSLSHHFLPTWYSHANFRKHYQTKWHRERENVSFWYWDDTQSVCVHASGLVLLAAAAAACGEVESKQNVIKMIIDNPNCLRKICLEWTRLQDSHTRRSPFREDSFGRWRLGVEAK